MRTTKAPGITARERAAKRRKLLAAYKAACQVVDARDGGRCVNCCALGREHHHLKPRSTHPELYADPDNIVTLCGACHQRVQRNCKESAPRLRWLAGIPDGGEYNAMTRGEAIAALAECYRLTGADTDGDEDWRIARRAVQEVRRLRQEHDDLESTIELIRREP